MGITFNILPAIVFFIAYKFYGVFVATSVAMALFFVQFCYLRIRKKKVSYIFYVSLLLILVLGGATIYFRNSLFIKWKPTIIFWVIGLSSLFSKFFSQKTFVQQIVSDKILLEKTVWEKLNSMWMYFFFGLGTVNLLVAYHFSTSVWVYFKLFGILSCLLLFVIFQSIYIAKNIKE